MGMGFILLPGGISNEKKIENVENVISDPLRKQITLRNMVLYAIKATPTALKNHKVVNLEFLEKYAGDVAYFIHLAVSFVIQHTTRYIESIYTALLRM